MDFLVLFGPEALSALPDAIRPRAPAVEVERPPLGIDRRWTDASGAQLDMLSARGGGAAPGWRLTLPGVACASRPLEQLLELPGKVARVDLAIDTDGPCTPRWLYNRLRTRRVVSKWRNATYLCSFQITDPQAVGETVYLGRRGSEAFLRVYDRAALLGVDGRLSRHEVELRGRLAGAAWDVLREAPDVVALATRVLTSRVRVLKDRIAEDRSNVTRMPVAKAWRKLWQVAEPIAANDPGGTCGEITRRRVRALMNLSRALWVAEKLHGESAIRALLKRGESYVDAPDRHALTAEDAYYSSAAELGIDVSGVLDVARPAPGDLAFEDASLVDENGEVHGTDPNGAAEQLDSWFTEQGDILAQEQWRVMWDRRSEEMSAPGR